MIPSSNAEAGSSAHLIAVGSAKGDPEPADYSKKWADYPYAHLVRSTREFIVFIDDKGELDWVTSAELDALKEKQTAEQKEAANQVLGLVAIAQASPSAHLDLNAKRNFTNLLGEAIVCYCQNDYATADKMVAAALKFHRDRAEELSRSWYLTAAARTTICALLAAVPIWLLRAPLTDAVGAAAVELALYAIAGSVGALLSVIARSGDLKFSANSGQPLHDLEATTRIAAGAISAVLTILAMKSGLILGSFSQGENYPYLLCFAAVAAGAAERFGSSIISRFESASGATIATAQNIKEDK